MAKTILDSKKSSVGSPYAYYTLKVEEVSRTPTQVKLKYTAYGWLQYDTSYLGTGSGMGLKAGVYTQGEWHEWTLKKESVTWSGKTKHSASKTITLDITAAKSSFEPKFRVQRSDPDKTAASLKSTQCSAFSITNVANKYGSVALSAAALSQAAIRGTIAGLPSAVGYDSTINWYLNGVYKGATPVSSITTATSFAFNFTGLVPSTAYTIRADVVYGSTVLATKTIVSLTADETGTLGLTSHANYLTVNVSGMFYGPNYTRNLLVYYKKSTDASYTLYTTLYSQTGSAAVNITGLTSNQEYNIIVYIRNGTTTLRTLSGTVKTVADTSLVPTGIINNISQILGRTPCEVTVDWTSDKSVAGTSYALQAKGAEDADWVTLQTYTAVTSPVTLSVEYGNEDVEFRIVTQNASVASGITNTSAVYTFYIRDDFLWDTDKIAGEVFVLTASEWNRLGEYAIARNAAIGIQITIPLVKSGDPVTAEIYNAMKNHINNITAIDIADKKRGDCITAADIDALRVAINSAA